MPIKRCIINLIDNALSYGKRAEILMKKTMNKIISIHSFIPQRQYKGTNVKSTLPSRDPAGKIIKEWKRMRNHKSITIKQ